MNLELLIKQLQSIQQNRVRSQINISNLENATKKLDAERNAFQELTGMEKLLTELIRIEREHIEKEKVQPAMV